MIGLEGAAREQLGLMIDDKADEWTKSCYEAYAADAASENLMEKLKEEQMDRLFLEIEMPLVFTLRRYGGGRGARVEAGGARHLMADQLGWPDRAAGVRRSAKMAGENI